MAYTGGKSGSGTYQKIINQIPPHHVYIEPFLGHGGILRAIRPARSIIGIDSDASVIQDWHAGTIAPGVESLTIIHGDGLAWLKQYKFTGDEFVYADPPYLKVDIDGRPVRKSQRDAYAHEFATVEQHTELLQVLRSLPCKVALSGYWSSLYMSVLDDWRSIHFEAVTRSGEMATEYLWMNYPEPMELHDYRYLGNNFREREKITRQKRRWIARLQKMDRLQRLALMDAIASIDK